MKLKTVHTYQSVKFNKQQETHFDAGKPSMAKIEMTYNSSEHCVLISMPGCESVMIFSTNIAYAVPENESDILGSEKSEKSSKLFKTK